MAETPQRSVRIEEALWERLRAYAVRVDMTPSELVRRVLREKFLGETMTMHTLRKGPRKMAGE